MQAPLPPGARRILLAAEDGIDRHITASVLADEGHVLSFANDGTEALALLQQQAFDLLLLDVPLLETLEATRNVRALPGAERGIAILALSANATVVDREQQADAGVTGCLSKPFEWNRIHAAIARHAPAGSSGDAVVESDGGPPAVLVDPEVLDRLQARTSPDDLHSMVRSAMAAYGLYCDTMLKVGAGPVVIAREAHKIRGSAGTFGLSRISGLAGDIEAALRRNVAVDGVVRQLKIATDQTRDELQRMGAFGRVACEPVSSPA